MRVFPFVLEGPTDQVQLAFEVVPNCESKYAVELIYRIPTPFGDRCQQNFGVAVRLERVSKGTQLFAQFAVIVDLAIESEDVTAIMRQHRLVARG